MQRRKGHGYSPGPTPPFDPYSKFPNYTSALEDFLTGMKMMKEFRARQKHHSKRIERSGGK